MYESSLRLIGAPVIASALVACGGGNDAPIGEIVNVTGNLYEARTATHNTVFLVTSAGIILCDPINLEFAQWLDTELAERFDVPVTYVIYSHHHPDHSVGGVVFEDTATFVAHEAVVTARAAPLPSNAVELDLDGVALLRCPATPWSSISTVMAGFTETRPRGSPTTGISITTTETVMTSSRTRRFLLRRPRPMSSTPIG